MGDCKPCAKPIALVDNSKKCKPFRVCVGNKALIWDGDCAFIQDREYQIPNGTFTSITFEDGCIVDVGVAPLPVYTPRSCCGEGGYTGDVEGGSTGGSASDGTLTVSPEPGNLASIRGGALSVVGYFGNSDVITVSGDGSVRKPWTPSLKVSKDPNNRLKVTDVGLAVNVAFQDTDKVKIIGDGTPANPFSFEIKAADVNLPEIHKESFDVGLFEVDKFGRVESVNVDGDVKLVYNLTSKNKVLSVLETPKGVELDLNLDNFEPKLYAEDAIVGKGSLDEPFKLSAKVSDGLVGEGTTDNPIKLKPLMIGDGLEGNGVTDELRVKPLSVEEGVIGTGTEQDPFRVDVLYLTTKLKEYGFLVGVPQKVVPGQDPTYPKVKVDGKNISISGLTANKKARIVFYNGDTDENRFLLGDVDKTADNDGNITAKLAGLPDNGQVMVVVDNNIVWVRF